MMRVRTAATSTSRSRRSTSRQSATAPHTNKQSPPFNKPEVRWALALSLDLQTVGITAVSGQFKPAALPIADTPITNPVFYKPLDDFLNNLTLSDGYKPFDSNFGQALVDKLKAQGTP